MVIEKSFENVFVSNEVSSERNVHWIVYDDETVGPYNSLKFHYKNKVDFNKWDDKLKLIWAASLIINKRI